MLQHNMHGGVLLRTRLGGMGNSVCARPAACDCNRIRLHPLQALNTRSTNVRLQRSTCLVRFVVCLLHDEECEGNCCCLLYRACSHVVFQRPVVVCVCMGTASRIVVLVLWRKAVAA